MKRPPATPRQRLAEIRESQARVSAELKDRIMEAMLMACGELGYRAVTVQTVLERFGGYRGQFYRHFANLPECYATAYEVWSERLCASLLGAGRSQPTWARGLTAALGELARFASERPFLARGLLTEVHVAGGPARIKREEVLARFISAVDRARRDTGAYRSPPPLTAAFMTSAIDAAVSSAPESFGKSVPELVRIIVAAYYGEEAATEQLQALGAA